MTREEIKELLLKAKEVAQKESKDKDNHPYYREGCDNAYAIFDCLLKVI